MNRGNNYLIQAGQAKQRFLTYDQQTLIQKFQLQHDSLYLYVNFLCKQYRLNRKTGDLEYREGAVWKDGNSYGEVMTLLDLLCDSREDRSLSGQWRNMQSFGLMFHRNLLEDARDPFAELLQQNQEAFAAACVKLGGTAVTGADIGYAIELFDGLRIAVQFWYGDEEFAPRVRYLWDANAGQYLRYETMHFAVGLLRQRITEEMKKN